MQIIETETSTHYIKALKIKGVFNLISNVVVSGNSIIQLPCQVGKRSYTLKKIELKLNNRNQYYYIQGKKYSKPQLRKQYVEANQSYIIDSVRSCPF